MNGSTAALFQAIRGPILLITLGVLVAIDHAEGPRFFRTWPLLLIVFGVMKLIERATRPIPIQAPNGVGPYPPPPGVGPTYHNTPGGPTGSAS